MKNILHYWKMSTELRLIQQNKKCRNWIVWRPLFRLSGYFILFLHPVSHKLWGILTNYHLMSEHWRQYLLEVHMYETILIIIRRLSARKKLNETSSNYYWSNITNAVTNMLPITVLSPHPGGLSYNIFKIYCDA